MVPRYNLKSYLSNPSRIFQIEAMEAVLWLIKRVYFFLLTRYFPGFFGHFESLAFSQIGDKPCTKAVKQDVFSRFFKGTTSNNCSKKRGCFD